MVRKSSVGTGVRARGNKLIRPAPQLVLSQIPLGHKSSAEQWPIWRLHQVDKKPAMALANAGIPKGLRAPGSNFREFPGIGYYVVLRESSSPLVSCGAGSCFLYFIYLFRGKLKGGVSRVLASLLPYFFFAFWECLFFTNAADSGVFVACAPGLIRFTLYTTLPP